MAKIDSRQIRHYSNLSKIDLSDHEELILSEQISKILDYFKSLDEVDTSGVEATHHVVDLKNIFRNDEVRKSPSDEMLKLAPSKKGRYVKAPKIV